MAKGNDGNLLQHTIEAEIARGLSLGCTRGVYVVLTHGMAPFESFTPRATNPSAYRLLDRWLNYSASSNFSKSDLAVVDAYRGCRASSLYYPNSAEVCAAIVPDISGCIAEVDATKYSQLAMRWKNTAITVHHQSWRFNGAEMLSPPRNLDRAWLISLDPMTFTLSDGGDDDKFRLEDLKLIARKWDAFVATGQSGAMVAICYSLQPTTAEAYRKAAKEVDLPNLLFLETVARGGNRHVAAIWSTATETATCVQEAWAHIATAKSSPTVCSVAARSHSN